MSYILDALRRAEAERERGAVPGLHTQQFGALPGPDDRPSRAGWLIAAVVVLSLALLAVLGWNVWRDDVKQQEPITAKLASATRASAPAIVAAPEPTLPSTAATGTVAATGAAAPTRDGGATAAAPSSSPASAVMGGREPSTGRRSADRQPIPAAVRAPRTSTSDAPAPGRPSRAAPSTLSQAQTLGDMPEDVRRQMPTISIGGASYSNDAASRMVMVNGHVFHEGDTITPGLVLTQIKLKSAVVTYKGFRHELIY